MNAFELPILDFIAEYTRCGLLDFLMPKITALGDAGICWIVLAIALLIPKKTRKTGIAMGIALVLGLIVCNMTLKPLVARIRPYEVAGISPYLIEAQHDYSFPSGHTIASFEGASVILFRHKKWGIAALVFAALIAFSRMYLYVHYPTDILASIVLGTLFGWLGCYLVDTIEKRSKTKSLKLK